jgi:hypothetical protein
MRSRPLRMHGDPIAMGNRHCRDCQRATGSAFAGAVLVPVGAVNISGEVKYYAVIGDSGAIARCGFCPNCGARLFCKPAASPDITGIMAGSLDDPSRFRPQADIYTATAQPWDYMNPICPRSPGCRRNRSVTAPRGAAVGRGITRA